MKNRDNLEWKLLYVISNSTECIWCQDMLCVLLFWNGEGPKDFTHIPLIILLTLGQSYFCPSVGEMYKKNIHKCMTYKHEHVITWKRFRHYWPCGFPSQRASNADKRCAFCFVAFRLSLVADCYNKVWWQCLVPTSTTRFASDVGYRMAKM